MRTGQQPAGQIADLGELSQVSSFQDEVRARHGGPDPLTGRLQPLVTAADQGDRQPLASQPAG